MADERIVVQVEDKVAPTIEPRIKGIGTAARTSYTALQQLQQMLNSINGSGLSRLQSLLQQTAAASSALAQAQAAMNAQNAQAALILQRVATEAQRTQIQITNLAVAQQRLIQAQNNTARSSVDLNTAQNRLTTSQRDAAAAAQNLAGATDRARTAAIELQIAQRNLANANRGAADSLLQVAKAAAAAAAISVGGGGVLKMADDYTLLQNKLVNVAEDQASVNMIMKETADISNTTGQNLTSTVSMFQKFDNALKEMGGGQEETLRIVETLNKSVIVSGANASEAAGGILQLSQAFGSGRLQGDEFRSMMENLPVVADMIAKSMGKTRGELKALSTQGKITTAEMRKAFADAATEIDAKFAKTTLTLTQQFQVLNNKLTVFVGEVNESIGLTSALSQVVRFLGNNIEAVSAVLAIFSALLLVAFGPRLISAIGTARTAILAFNAALIASPIGLLIVGLTTLIALTMAFGDKFKVAGEEFVTFKDVGLASFSLLKDGIAATAKFVSENWGKFIDWVNEKTGGMGEKFRDIFGLIMSVSKTNTNFLIGLFVGSFNAITKYWSLFPDIMKTIFANAANFGATAVESVVNSWQMGLREITGLLGTIAPDVAKSLNGALDSVKLELPRMETGKAVGDMAKDIGKQFADAFNKDYVGDAADALMLRARSIAAQRAGQAAGSLRGATDKKAPDIIDPKAAKIAERRALTLAKINGELDKELDTMFVLNPQRAIEQQFDQIQINLAAKKIKLTEREADSIRNKIVQLQQNKELQQAFDSIYEDSIKDQRDYNNTMDAAAMLYDQGSISLERYQRTINMAGEAYADSLDPMRQFNKSLDDQAKLLGIMGPSRDIEAQIIQKRNEMVAKGIPLDEEALRVRLTAAQAAAELDNKVSSYYDNTIGRQRELSVSLAATDEAYKKGYLSSEQYGIRLQQLALDTANLKMQMGDATWTDTFTASLGGIVNGFDGMMSGVSRSFSDFFTSFTDGFADSIGQAVVTSQSLGDALHNVAQQAVAGLISSLIKLGMQYVANAALGTTVNATALATQTAASVAAASTAAIAWAPAASLASLASFGANSVPAMAGITATTALTEGIALASMAGFQSGGYTGDIGTSDVAGVVHGREFVVNARATAQNREMLEAMNAGRSVSASASTSTSSGSGNASPINISIVNNMGESAEVTVNQLTEQDVELIISKKVPGIMATEAANANSPYIKTMRSGYALPRKN